MREAYSKSSARTNYFSSLSVILFYIYISHISCPLWGLSSPGYTASMRKTTHNYFSCKLKGTGTFWEQKVLKVWVQINTSKHPLIITHWSRNSFYRWRPLTAVLGRKCTYKLSSRDMSPTTIGPISTVLWSGNMQLRLCFVSYIKVSKDLRINYYQNTLQTLAHEVNICIHKLNKFFLEFHSQSAYF